MEAAKSLILLTLGSNFVKSDNRAKHLESNADLNMNCMIHNSFEKLELKYFKAILGVSERAY